MPLLSVVFGRANDAFRLVDAKISRLEIDAPADRYVTATVTFMGRYIETYTKPTLPPIPTQVFTSKEGTFSYGEVASARIRIDNRLDPRHTIKPTPSQRVVDYLAEMTTEITGEAEVFWTPELANLHNNTLPEVTINLNFTDWATSTQTMQVTISNAKLREVSLDIPSEREITGRIEFVAVSFSIV